METFSTVNYILGCSTSCVLLMVLVGSPASSWVIKIPKEGKNDIVQIWLPFYRFHMFLQIAMFWGFSVFYVIDMWIFV